MKSLRNVLVSGAVGCLLMACGTTSQKAPVEDRNAHSGSQQPAVPSSVPAAVTRSDESSSIYIVKKGDTLFRIALDKGQSYSDIVAWNSLANPNDIKVGQKLRVSPPDENSASRSSNGVEVRPVLSAPAGNNKNGPRADKRPYSDATLAEMQKNENPDAGVGISTTKQPGKTAENSQEVQIVDEIVWFWPSEGKVVANFDDNKNKGIDISGKMGQDIYSAAAGTVMYAGSGIRGYGNLVIIKHSNNFLSAYAHNRTIVVKEKQVISKGQKIAEMGNSDSDVVKLHFEIRQQGKPVDPLKFLPGR